MGPAHWQIWFFNPHNSCSIELLFFFLPKYGDLLGESKVEPRRDELPAPCGVISTEMKANISNNGCKYTSVHFTLSEWTTSEKQILSLVWKTQGIPRAKNTLNMALTARKNKICSYCGFSLTAVSLISMLKCSNFKCTGSYTHTLLDSLMFTIESLGVKAHANLIQTEAFCCIDLNAWNR